MDFLQPFFQYAIKPSRDTQKSRHCYVYGDESNKKTTPVKVKKKAHFEFESEALIQKDICKKSFEVGNEKDDMSRGPNVNMEKSGVQVKILMTKEEAARLLSKCKDGGVLEFKDVANELVQIPNNRIDFVVSSSSHKKNE
ncbi:hypothetical protein PHJA_002775100 [Phtheirospermum japonicum]|uniref:DUF7890 domain-containing protein n=1 Tax=Phtheirospermum japonicum TaxID=374723 RepID=A0A830D2G5_9LAMI|nr:hypothetical protein PHJA_002775100 [Phtheirospermum japonicum]